MPDTVRDVFSYALVMAQGGMKHPKAKPLKGLGSGIFEVVVEHKGDAFRLVYSAHLEKIVFVAHCFKKKSNKGAKAPKIIVDTIRDRLRHFYSEPK